MSDSKPEVPDAVPAATVVVLREAAGGFQTLLLRRNSALGFGGGAWVFPGGRVDEADRDGDALDDETAVRRAAVREVAEEAGLVLEPNALVPFSHWTPPLMPMPRRFATSFFLGEAPATLVVVDGGEIVDHVWVRPADALGRHAAGDVELMPPTFVTLTMLSEHADVASALAAAARGPVPRYVSRFASLDGIMVSLYAGDAGYDDANASRTGPRHRLWMGAPADWRYERGS